MQIAAATGQAGYGDGNTNVPLKSGNEGALIVNEMKGRYSELTKRGQVFNAASQALYTSTSGLTATQYRGLALYNPINSSVKLELLFASLMQSVIQATQVEGYAIAVGWNNTTNVIASTALTIRNNLVGNSIAANAGAISGGTLPTAPFYHTFMGNTATATQNGGLIQTELAGRIILPPGAYACFVTPTQASVAGLWASFDWTETPTGAPNAAPAGY